jgi:hypothetical protein
MWSNPAAASASIHLNFAGVAMVIATDWSPSRGPTSTTLTSSFETTTEENHTRPSPGTIKKAQKDRARPFGGGTPNRDRPRARPARRRHRRLAHRYATQGRTHVYLAVPALRASITTEHREHVAGDTANQRAKKFIVKEIRVHHRRGIIPTYWIAVTVRATPPKVGGPYHARTWLPSNESVRLGAD